VWNALPRGKPAALPILARGIGEFLLDAARRRTLVLFVERTALSDPLAEAVLAHLTRAVTRAPRSPGGGLLLIVENKKAKAGERKALG
jgi:hypothetical protein